jgi:hypothetical protein
LAGYQSEPFCGCFFLKSREVGAGLGGFARLHFGFAQSQPNFKLLGKQARFPGPAWYVLWGDTKLGYAVYVNATTGEIMNVK